MDYLMVKFTKMTMVSIALYKLYKASQNLQIQSQMNDSMLFDKVLFC